MLALSALFASAFFSASPAAAIVRDWEGDASTSWSTLANWFNDTSPISGFTADIANFNLPAYGGNPIFAPDAGTYSINGITIGSANGPMTLSGVSLGIGSSGITIASGAGAFQLAPTAISTQDPQSWTNNSASPLLVASNLSLQSATVLTFAGTNSTILNGFITQTSSRTLNFSSSVPTIVNGNIYLSNVNNAARTLTLGGTGHGIINGSIANFNGTGLASALTVNSATLLLTLKGASTYSGVTTLSAGTINVNNATAFGVSSSLAMNGITLDNTTGAPLTLSANNVQSWGGNNIFNGTNDLNLGTGTAALTATRSWTTIGGKLTVGGAITGAFTLNKLGSGTMTLSGANTNSGTTINGGRLVLDYAANTLDPLPTTHTIGFNQGNLTLRGRTGVAVTDTLTTATLSQATGASNVITFDANGGPGVGLTISTLGSTSSLGSTLIDLSSSAGNSLTISAFASTVGTGTDNVILASNTTVGSRRANIIVRDAAGYGFARTSGATSGTVTPLTTGTTLTASSSGGTVNYRLTSAGTVTRSADLDFQTLTIDSTAGAVVLDMNSKTFLVPATGAGRGILLTGSNDISITNGSIPGGLSSYTYNYTTGSAVVTIGLAAGAGGGAHLYGGTGNYNYTANFLANDQGYQVYTGNFRVTTAQDLTALAVPYVVSGGGVWEIGADLNGGTAGDLTTPVKDYASGTAGFTFYGDSGISAAGANRVVNFGGATATLTWGSAGFLTTIGASPVDGGYTLKLSSSRSDASLEIQNPIALGTRLRIVDVANGSSNVDAILSGVLSGTVNNAAPAFTKNGAGTLTLSAANTYSGVTTVNAGMLAVTGSLANNGPANILMAAPDDTLAGNATLARRVLAASSYTLSSATGLGSTAVSTDPVTAANFNTTAAILAGTASSQADVSMQWRTRSVAESTGDNAIISDVVNLTGVAPVGAYTDVFLLEMSYSDAALAALSLNEAVFAADGTLRLAWFNGTTWTTAVDGNSPASNKTFEGNLSSAAFLSSIGVSPLSSKLGSYGVDTANNKVWAVLNHNSEFAVIPEPSTIVLGALCGLGLVAHRVRRRKVTKTV